MSKDKKVMVFGTFNILHPGHLNFLEQAKNYGDYLIVVVARDINVKRIKGFFPKLNETARKKIVESLKIVDKAVLGNKTNWLQAILKNKPDVICFGYDQKVPDNFEKILKNNKVKLAIFKLKPYKPEKYKASIILDS
jgi:FAD synthetase